MKTNSNLELEVQGNHGSGLSREKVKRDHAEVLQGELLLSKTSPNEFSSLVHAEMSGGSNSELQFSAMNLESLQNSLSWEMEFWTTSEVMVFMGCGSCSSNPFFLNSYIFLFFFFLIKVLLHLYTIVSDFAVGKCSKVAFLSPFHFLLIKLSRLSFWDNKKTVQFKVYSCIFALEIIHGGTQTHFFLCRSSFRIPFHDEIQGRITNPNVL